MKNNVKIVIAFILGILITSGVVLAASANANDISYGNGTVKDALDDLYQVRDNKSTCLYVSGTKGQVSAKYLCDPGDGVARYFYILKVSGNDVKLIMDRNLSDTVGSAKRMTFEDANSFVEDNNIDTLWNNVKDVGLPTASEIATAGGIPNFDVSTATENNWSFFGTNSTTNTNYRTNYLWLWDYTRDCSNTGCSHSLSSDYAYGYWTTDLTVGSDNSSAWRVSNFGCLDSRPVNTTANHGVRPVITISQSKLSN